MTINYDNCNNVLNLLNIITFEASMSHQYVKGYYLYNKATYRVEFCKQINRQVCPTLISHKNGSRKNNHFNYLYTRVVGI